MNCLCADFSITYPHFCFIKKLDEFFQKFAQFDIAF